MIFGNQSHLEMITALLDNKVEFLIVGGYAVILHGYIRTTGDLDIWIKSTYENKVRLLDMFSKMDFDPAGIRAIAEKDFTSIVVFHIGEEPDRIDFLSHIEGVNFDLAQGRQETIPYLHYQIPFLHLDDLILNKVITNRLQDQADVEALQRVIRNKP